MNIDGEMISVTERHGEFYMSMKVDEASWEEVREFALGCCQDYCFVVHGPVS